MSILETRPSVTGWKDKGDEPTPPPFVLPHMKEILRGFRCDPKGIHGLRHWAAVEANCRRLAVGMDADLTVCTWFAWLHDCRRWDDGHDGMHGDRAADFAMTLLSGNLRVDQLDTLYRAIALHGMGNTDGRNSTMAVCWDSDRLCLRRFMTRLEPEFFSTPLGRSLACAA